MTSSMREDQAQALLSHPTLLGELHARACALLSDALSARAEGVILPVAAALPRTPVGASTPRGRTQRASHSVKHPPHPALSALVAAPLVSAAAVGSGGGGAGRGNAGLTDLLAPTAGVREVQSAETAALAAHRSTQWFAARRTACCGVHSACSQASVAQSLPLLAAHFERRIRLLLSAGHVSLPDTVTILRTLLDEEEEEEAVATAAAASSTDSAASQPPRSLPSSLASPSLQQRPLPPVPLGSAYLDFLIYLVARLDSTASTATAASRGSGSGGGGGGLVHFVPEMHDTEQARAHMWARGGAAPTKALPQASEEKENEQESKEQSVATESEAAFIPVDGSSLSTFSSPVYACMSFLHRATRAHLSRENVLDLRTPKGAFVLLLLEHEVMANLLGSWMLPRTSSATQSAGGNDDGQQQQRIEVFARLLPQVATLERSPIARHARDAANPFFHAPLHASFRLRSVPSASSSSASSTATRDMFLTMHDVHSLISASFVHALHDQVCPRAQRAFGGSGDVLLRSSPASDVAMQPSPFAHQLELLHQRVLHPPAIPSTPHARIALPSTSGSDAPHHAAATSALLSRFCSTAPAAPSGASALVPPAPEVSVPDPYAAAHRALNLLALERPSSRVQALRFKRGSNDHDEGNPQGAAVLHAFLRQREEEQAAREARDAEAATAAFAAATAAASVHVEKPLRSSSSSAGAADEAPFDSPFAARNKFVPRAALQSRGSGGGSHSPSRSLHASGAEQKENGLTEEDQAALDTGSLIPDLLAARKEAQERAQAAASSAAVSAAAAAASSPAAGASSRIAPIGSLRPPPAAAALHVTVHNNMLARHPARGFVLRLHDATLPNSLLVVAQPSVPHGASVVETRSHVHPSPDEIALARAARAQAVRTGRRVKKPPRSEFVPVETVSLQPAMAQRMADGFEKEYLERLSRGSGTAVPVAQTASNLLDTSPSRDASPTRNSSASPVATLASTAFFHSPDARALHSSLRGGRSPSPTRRSVSRDGDEGVDTSSSDLFASMLRPPRGEDLLGEASRSLVGQHASLTNRSRHWERQHKFKAEQAKLSLANQNASSSSSASVHPSAAAVKERLGQSSVAPPLAADCRPVVPARPSTSSGQPVQRTFDLPQEGEQNHPDALRPRTSPLAGRVHSRHPSRHRRSPSSGGGSGEYTVAAEDSPNHEEHTPSSPHGSSELSPWLEGTSVPLASPAPKPKPAAVSKPSARSARGNHSRSPSRRKSADAGANAIDANDSNEQQNDLELNGPDASVDSDAEGAGGVDASLAEQAFKASLLTGSSVPGLEPVVATIFRSSEHVVPQAADAASNGGDNDGGRAQTPRREDFMGAAGGQNKGVGPSLRRFLAETRERDGLLDRREESKSTPATTKKTSAGADLLSFAKKLLATKTPEVSDPAAPAEPQVRLRNNAAPRASRVRTSRAALAVSAFAARTMPATTRGPVLAVLPLQHGLGTPVLDPASAAAASSTEGVSLRLRLLLAGTQSARRAAEDQLGAGGGSPHMDPFVSPRAQDLFPLRSALGANAHHAKEALAALALSGGEGSIAGGGARRGSTLYHAPDGSEDEFSVSGKLRRKARKAARTARREAGHSGHATPVLGHAPVDGSIDAAATSPLDSSADTAPADPTPVAPVRVRRTWFDIKMSQDGPTRKQVIAERQRELAWAIHRRRVHEGGHAHAHSQSQEKQHQLQQQQRVAAQIHAFAQEQQQLQQQHPPAHGGENDLHVAEAPSIHSHDARDLAHDAFDASASGFAVGAAWGGTGSSGRHTTSSSLTLDRDPLPIVVRATLAPRMQGLQSAVQQQQAYTPTSATSRPHRATRQLSYVHRS